MRRLTWATVLLTGGLFWSAGPLRAVEGSSVHSGTKVLTGGNFLYYSDESKQGGKPLPGGATMLMAFSLQYNEATYFVGGGLFYHSDQAGESEKTAAMGLKLDLYIPGQPYYAEFGYAFSALQAFTNRAAESREGRMSYMGLGLRVALYSWLYIDGSIKQRQWNFTKEDGITLAAPITRTELIPYLGLGVAISL